MQADIGHIEVHRVGHSILKDAVVLEAAAAGTAGHDGHSVIGLRLGGGWLSAAGPSTAAAPALDHNVREGTTSAARVRSAAAGAVPCSRARAVPRRLFAAAGVTVACPCARACTRAGPLTGRQCRRPPACSRSPAKEPVPVPVALPIPGSPFAAVPPPAWPRRRLSRSATR